MRYLTRAEPLDDEALGDLVEEGLVDSVVLLDGTPYDADDLHACVDCGLLVSDPAELDHETDGDGRCGPCDAEAREAAADLEDLRSWHRWATR